MQAEMGLDPKVKAFLTDELRWGVLATSNPDGSIQQSVMWFDLEGDKILMNTKRGRLKDRNMLADPRLSLCFESDYKYVTIRGTASLIDDQERAHGDIHRLAVKYHGQERADEMMHEQFLHEERITVLMSIDSVSALARSLRQTSRPSRWGM